MIELALTFATVALIGLLTFSTMLVRTIRGMQRTHDRRIDELLNRLAHAERHPWVPPPVDEQFPSPLPRELLVNPDEEPL